MSKCLLTGEDTVNKTNGFPLSRDGRLLLIEVTNKYNDKLEEEFIESFKEASSVVTDDAIETARKLAPKVSKHDILKMLIKKTEEELFAEFDKGEESNVQED